MKRVGIAEWTLSNNPEDMLTACSLGSCLGISFYDRRKKTGAMAHCLLPFYQGKSRELEKPAMFVDTGIEVIIRRLQEIGCQKKDITIKAAGGSYIMDPKGVFNIGERNTFALRKSMAAQGMAIKNMDVGGNSHRTLCLEIKTGRVTVKIGRQTIEL